MLAFMNFSGMVMKFLRVLLVASVFSLAAQPSLAAEPIRIGAFLSTTGVMSPMGDPEKKTLELEVARVNAQGGVLGRPLELVLYDDGSVPEKAVVAVRRLIESDRVDVIIGGSGTPTSLTVLPLMDKAEMPFLSLGGGVAIIEPVRKWTFKVPQTDRLAAQKVYGDMKRRGLSRIALLSENVGFGKSGRTQCLELAVTHGMEIVADETYGPRDPDVTVQLTRIRATPGVQALFVFGTGQGPAVVTRNIRQLDLQMPVYQSHGVASKDFLRLVGKAADGMRLPSSPLAIVDVLPDSDRQKPVLAAFKRDFEAGTGDEVSMMAGHSWDALYLYLEAVKRAGTADKARVRDEIERTRGFVGQGGVFTLSPDDHMGLTLESLHMVEIQGGDWKLVE
ncbi:MAG: branched-chain amino acid transport system substrate-binding [Rhodospirillaceae bacterium]|nr:MAG: branched-chain amino acid transport system substrate-binding [Rhodospirillaceae bacterium]TNC97100.1 MAG: branched-chain amino acid transport system substrate-binding protein [Stygiobacter sp.]